MSIRKRIAVLAGELEEEYPKLFLQVFLSKAFEYDYDVCVFAMYRRFQESQAREIGESSIYALVNYKQYDAIVLMLDTIQTPGVAKKIEEEVRKHYHGPVLVVDTESDHFPYIEMSYVQSTKKLITHLIEHHGYKDIAYVTGWYGHKHSMQRLNAFRECMAEHGLSVREDWIYYGDFWYNGGEQLVTKLVTEGKKIPRAIACANDYMAIGAAKMLTKYGFRIPEDVAVIGYDMVEAGMSSPKPITSAPLPTESYGAYAAECVQAMFEGKELPEYVDDVELFIGSSCGCHNESVVPRVQLRERWDTEMSARAFYAPNNHMNEDLLCQTTIYELVRTIDYYIYQIRDFESFHICLNKDWSDYEKKEMEGRRDEIFSSKMLQVLRCGADEECIGEISFENYFERNQLLPELDAERDTPSAYFFTPLHFEEKCFGYAAISYGNQVRCYNATYRMWLRNVMQAFECFRRIEAIQRSNQMLEASMTRDVLTGLYNYNGFLKKKEQLERQILRNNVYIGVLAIDVKELMKINELYGRSEGDRTILLAARTLQDIFPEGLGICFGNGEMVTIMVSPEDISETMKQRYDSMVEHFAKDKMITGRDYDIEMYYGIEVGKPQNGDELERLVNVAISKKNGNKVRDRKFILGENFTEAEMQEARIVEKILNENLFKYHFQPIIDAKNGEIFGYEALMRPDVNPYMAPPVVLKYAEYYGRLYDVERYTFFNVLDIVQKNKDIFDGNVKVFINSIPGNLLKDDDAKKLEGIARELPDTVMVELTEQQELTDEELSLLQDYLNTVGFQTAIDDYGTGYSNVTNLLRYMPNCVKIDRMLLSNIEDSPQKQHFVKDIITFSHDNDIIVLAEGVETKEELKMVIQLGVDLIQGYYTARPSEEIVVSISKAVKNEILEYNRIGNDYKGRQVYISGKESHISLPRLVAEKYSIIEISDEGTKEVTISGMADMETDIYLRVKNGYRGKIILDNAILQGKRHGASIDIGNDCDVTLILRGENQCLNGGIRIPEDSRLTLEGEGHLYIMVDGANYFGIGNDFNARHGELVFEQSGCIEIKGNGMKGIGIGSGFGGPIRIHRGKYVIRMIGQDGVGIGSYSGDVDPLMKDCDVRIDMATARAVGVGSIMGSANIHLEYLAWNGELNAEEAIGLGTFAGKKSEVGISHANVMINLFAARACGIGANNGMVSMYVDRSSVIVAGDGTEAVAWGNQSRSAKIRVNAGKMESRLHTALAVNVGVTDENVTLDKSEYHYMKNGETVILKAE